MSKVEPYLFRTRPYLRTKVWGGDNLEREFGKKKEGAEAGEPIGEAWEVADLEEGESIVDSGPMEGRPLSELVEAWGTELIGTDAPEDRFPLLVKILDAQADLSVQVHPGEEDVRTNYPDADSKDECWYVLGVDDGGSILHGVDEGLDAKTFRKGVEENQAADLLRRVYVEPGDVTRVVPGTLHAICKGVVLLEIQEPSDTTFRVYDYNRPGLDGEPRELHLDDAMAVANFGEQPPVRIDGESRSVEAGDITLLIDIDAYRIERFNARAPARWSVKEASPQVIFVADGRARLKSGEAEVDLEYGETAVIPAVCGDVELTPGKDGVTLIGAGLGGHPIFSSDGRRRRASEDKCRTSDENPKALTARS